MNSQWVIKNIQKSGFLVKDVLNEIKYSKTTNLTRSELSELNHFFIILDNSIGDLFFQINKLNKIQKLKDNYQNKEINEHLKDE